MRYFCNSAFYREETERSIIDNLLRKGWKEIYIPEFDTSTHSIEYDSSLEDFKLVPKIKTTNDIVRDGFLVLPENFVLSLQEADRSLFTQMLSLVKEALDLGLITNDTPQTIADKDGQKHEISTLRFRQIMVQYGFYYKNLWDQMT